MKTAFFRAVVHIAKSAIKTPVVLVFLAFAGQRSANAALTLINADLVYDTELNVTWQTNAGLAITNNFGVAGIDGNGYMNWATANAWIAAMNAANFLGYNDWRLPHSSENFGYNNSTSPDEMGHLYYAELGGSPAGGLGTTGPFSGISNAFWSDHIASWNTGTTYFFSFGGPFITPGYQTAAWQTTTGTYSAMAVRNGFTNAAPEPSQAILVAGGLMAAALRRRKRWC